MKYLLPFLFLLVACGGSGSGDDTVVDVVTEAEDRLDETLEETDSVADELDDAGDELVEDFEDELEDSMEMAEDLADDLEMTDMEVSDMDETDLMDEEDIDDSELSEMEMLETSEPARDSFITGRTFRPSSSSGFQCQSAETRGGQTVCLLPYEYTLPPFYTKTDHHGHRFGCNVNGDTFESFTLIAGGQEFPMFIEKENPFGPEEGVPDYFCANFVATPEGQIGRTHVRLRNSWGSFNGSGVSIRICDQGLCDTLILR